MSINLDSLQRDWKSVDNTVQQLQLLASSDLMMAEYYDSSNGGKYYYQHHNNLWSTTRPDSTQPHRSFTRNVQPPTRYNVGHPQYAAYHGTTSTQEPMDSASYPPQDRATYEDAYGLTTFEMQEFKGKKQQKEGRAVSVSVEDLVMRFDGFSKEMEKTMKAFYEQLKVFYSETSKSLKGFEQQLQTVQSDMNEVKEFMNDSSSNTSEAKSGGRFLGMFGAGTSQSSKKSDIKKQLQESLKLKEDQIRKLEADLQRYNADINTKSSRIKNLEAELHKYKKQAEQKEQEASTAKQEKQAMIYKVRSWEEGHHRPGKRKQSEISDDYALLFKNKSRPILKFLKEPKYSQITDVERRTLLCQIFEIAYKECKLHVLGTMFDELFKPHSQTMEGQPVSLRLATEQAKIYGHLCGKTVQVFPDTIVKSIVTEVQLRIPKLTPLVSESPVPEHLLTFIQHATNVAWDMVSSQPPMFIQCPPVTKKQFNPEIHEETSFWIDDAADDDTLVYHQPILYSNFAASYADSEVKGRLAHPEVLPNHGKPNKHQSHHDKHWTQTSVQVGKKNQKHQPAPDHEVTFIEGDDPEQDKKLEHTV